jgi:hypothetical protein
MEYDIAYAIRQHAIRPHQSINMKYYMYSYVIFHLLIRAVTLHMPIHQHAIRFHQSVFIRRSPAQVLQVDTNMQDVTHM